MKNETPDREHIDAKPLIEKLTIQNAQEYSDFFCCEIQKDPVYDDAELSKIIRQHSFENILSKIADQSQVQYLLRREGVLVGVLEVKVVSKEEKNKLLSKIFDDLGLNGLATFGYMSWILSANDKDGKKRSGVATELYLKGIEELKLLGVTFLVAGMRDDNEASINLHAKMGFQKNHDLPQLDGYVWYSRDI